MRRHYEGPEDEHKEADQKLTQPGSKLPVALGRCGSQEEDENVVSASKGAGHQKEYRDEVSKGAEHRLKAGAQRC